MKQIAIKKILQGGIIGVSSLAIVAGTGSGILAQSGNRGDDGSRRGSYSHVQEDNNRRESRADRRANRDSSATCEERQQAVDDAVSAFKQRANSKVVKLTTFYVAQKNYVESSNLDVDNYEQLTQRADRSGMRAAQAIADLDSPQVNCNRSRRNDVVKVYRAEKPVKRAVNRYSNRVSDVVRAIWSEVR